MRLMKCDLWDSKSVDGASCAARCLVIKLTAIVIVILVVQKLRGPTWNAHSDMSVSFNIRLQDRITIYVSISAHLGLSHSNDVVENSKSIVFSAFIIWFKTSVIEIVVFVDAAFGEFEEDAVVVLIVMRITIVDKLLGSGLPPCNFIIIDLAVLDDKPHEILDHVSLALL